MTTEPLLEAAIAANRFGLGARPGDLGRIAADPRGWLRAQCDGAYELPAELHRLPDSRELYGMRGRPTASLIKLYEEHGAQWALAPVNSDKPFIERMVLFWSNHFAVSGQATGVERYAVAFEREAIRPHVLGKFADMLVAATGHPAMQIYLDNRFSNGPHSFRGGNLNENHAREILELHTLGVDGGYTPRDLREFALTLTGWGIDARDAAADTMAFNPMRPPPPPGDSAAFAFDPDRHEPGPKWIFGKVIKGEGVREAEKVLHMLVEHPATARFIATKLARHFVADDPPQASIDRIADTFSRTGGDLREVTLALIDDPLAWGNHGNKLKSPCELVVSAARATGFHGGSGPALFQAMEELGQAPFFAGAPTGYPDTAESWLGGQAVLERVDFCADAGERAAVALSPPDFASEVLGPALRDATAKRVARAPGTAHGIGLVLASPEFQRR